jgi:hypothetical protein
VKKVLNFYKQLDETNLLCQNQDLEFDNFCYIHNIFCGSLSLESEGNHLEAIYNGGSGVLDLLVIFL